MCFRNTLVGDPSYNISAMTDDDVVEPWTRGFEDDNLCPQITPQPCEGAQCGPPPAAARAPGFVEVPDVSEVVI